MQIGTSGLQANGMQRPTLWVRKLKVKVTRGQNQIRRLSGSIILIPVG